MAITVNQIAELCHVSRTTVLRALNGTGSVRKETYELIIETARKYHYQPNLLARSLNHGHTNTIGVVMMNIANMYFVQRLDAINRTAEKNGYFTSIAVCDESLEEEKKLIQGLAARQVEGIILSPMNQGTEFESFLKSLGIPCVCLGNRISDEFTTVQVDERQAAEDAFEHIVQKKYQHVLFVCPPLQNKGQKNIYVHMERLEGIRLATARHPEIKVDILDDERYLDAINQYDFLQHEKIAILCSGDVYALEILNDLREKGILPPKQYGLMGFDDLSMLKYITPKLTTISTNVEGVASTAVNELIASIRDPDYEPRTIFLKHKIMDRETL
ncbi:MAG: LacI family DNA-binding transcriptional regulator [Lachnospiraceae bacterium]|nr:LacI family DNA-binding transcriptional regulator [Lachnospiraceae bacterium]